jgi:hypothetical protein
MNRTKRVVAIGLLCLGTTGLSFGDVFEALDSADWNATYTPSTALFGAVVQQGGAILQSGFPTGTVTPGNTFVSGTPQTFTLSYDPSSGLASFSIGSYTISDLPTLSVAPAGGGLDHIGIALSTGTSDDLITISNIALNHGTADTGVLSSEGEGLFDFAMTPPMDLTGGPLTLTGDIDMTFDSGTAPGSEISAEIVGADRVVAGPEPGTWALLGSALAGVGLLRRKRIV